MRLTVCIYLIVAILIQYSISIQLLDKHVLITGKLDENAYKWLDVKPINNTFLPPILSGSTSNIISNMMYYIGGCSLELDCSKNIYNYDINKGIWNKINTGYITLPPRSYHTSTVYNKRIFIFGGLSSNGYRNDMYILDTVDNKITQPLVTGILPNERSGHCTIQYQNRLYTFGGVGEKGYYNDLWQYDVRINTWVQLFDENTNKNNNINIPKPRAYHSCININELIYIYGGRDDYNIYDDIYTYDIKTKSWSRPLFQGQPPVPRHNALITQIHQDYIAIIGGCNIFKKQCYNDTDILNIDKLYWSKINLSQNNNETTPNSFFTSKLDDKLINKTNNNNNNNKNNTNENVVFLELGRPRLVKRANSWFPGGVYVEEDVDDEGELYYSDDNTPVFKKEEVQPQLSALETIVKNVTTSKNTTDIKKVDKKINKDKQSNVKVNTTKEISRKNDTKIVDNKKNTKNVKQDNKKTTKPNKKEVKPPVIIKEKTINDLTKNLTGTEPQVSLNNNIIVSNITQPVINSTTISDVLGLTKIKQQLNAQIDIEKKKSQLVKDLQKKRELLENPPVRIIEAKQIPLYGGFVGGFEPSTNMLYIYGGCFFEQKCGQDLYSMYIPKDTQFKMSVFSDKSDITADLFMF